MITATMRPEIPSAIPIIPTITPIMIGAGITLTFRVNIHIYNRKQKLREFKQFLYTYHLPLTVVTVLLLSPFTG